MADRRGRRRGIVLVGLVASAAGAGAWWFLRRTGEGRPVTDEWARAVAAPPSTPAPEPAESAAAPAPTGPSADEPPAVTEQPETTDASAEAEPQAVTEPPADIERPAAPEPAATGAPAATEPQADTEPPADTEQPAAPEPAATEAPADTEQSAATEAPADTEPAPESAPTALFAAATPSTAPGFTPAQGLAAAGGEGVEAPPTDDSPTVALPAVNPEEPYGPGSAVPLEDGSAPGPEFTIKGNASSMLFHPPSSPYFARTRAEAWFRTAADAERAGFTEWKPKPRAS